MIELEKSKNNTTTDGQVSSESQALRKEKKRKSPVVFYEEEKDGVKNLAMKFDADEKEDWFHTLAGTPNKDLALRIVISAVNALPKTMSDSIKHNLVFQNLADSAPRDAHEARLSSQAAVLYAQGLDFLERARSVTFDDDGTIAKDHWHKILMNTATKLLDLHNKTVESLMRYRQGGEQKITVQHVTVNDGGKAIVGSVLNEGGGPEKNGEVIP